MQYPALIQKSQFPLIINKVCKKLSLYKLKFNCTEIDEGYFILMLLVALSLLQESWWLEISNAGKEDQKERIDPL